MTAHTGETRNGEPLVELRDGDKIVLKAYPNADCTKLRIVLNELTTMRQVRIDDRMRMLEFDRVPGEVRRGR